MTFVRIGSGQLERGSLAARSGLSEQDIITSVDGRATTTVHDFKRAMQSVRIHLFSFNRLVSPLAIVSDCCSFVRAHCRAKDLSQ